MHWIGTAGEIHDTAKREWVCNSMEQQEGDFGVILMLDYSMSFATWNPLREKAVPDHIPCQR